MTTVRQTVRLGQILGILIGLVITVGAIFYYFQASEIAEARARERQMQKIDVVLKRLNDFVLVSRLVARFLETEVTQNELSKSEIEKHLIQFLGSTPPEIVYGMGVWFEPYRFNSKNRLFGPYAKREHSIEEQIQLTYEWNTESYNYPEQPWYVEGVRNKSTDVFVDPYFDAGLIYVSYIKAFFEKSSADVVRGVVGVDLVLPQLQNIVESLNLSELEYVSIRDKQNRFVAHSHRKELLSKLDVSVEEENLIKISDLEMKSALGVTEPRYTQLSVEQPDLKWTISILSNSDVLFKDLNALVNRIIAALVFVWVLILFFIWALRQKEHERELMSHEVEIARQQLMYSTKMAALGEMAGGVAHEINNPLTVINVYLASMLRRLQVLGLDDPKTFDTINRIDATSKRIARIVSGLRMFSRSGENDPFRVENLKAILDETLTLTLDRVRSAKIEFKLNCPDDLFIDCSAVQISQVIVNLVNNAIDAVEFNPEKWIRLDVVKLSNKRQIQVSVTDSGSGIDPAIAGKVLQPFFTTKEVGKGTGLGLSISKGIVERHGGELMYNGQSSNTQFVFTLPLAKV